MPKKPTHIGFLCLFPGFAYAHTIKFNSTFYFLLFTFLIQNVKHNCLSSFSAANPENTAHWFIKDRNSFPPVNSLVVLESHSLGKSKIKVLAYSKDLLAVFLPGERWRRPRIGTEWVLMSQAPLKRPTSNPAAPKGKFRYVQARVTNLKWSISSAPLTLTPCPCNPAVLLKCL